jgi:hypothetical protein
LEGTSTQIIYEKETDNKDGTSAYSGNQPHLLCGYRKPGAADCRAEKKSSTSLSSPPGPLQLHDNLSKSTVITECRLQTGQWPPLV